MDINLLKEDIEYGENSEKYYLEFLKEKFDNSLIKTQDKYALFDYENFDKSLFIELKTRRKCSSYTYTDTMIGLNKINYCKNNKNNTYYFVFKFTDGLYFWKFNENQPLNYRLGGRCDRNINEIKDYCYIPTNYLTKL